MMPRDAGLVPIQVLALDNGATMSTSAVSARVAIPAATSVIRVASSALGYFKFGDSSVTAASTDNVFPAGVEVFNISGYGYTHLAFINDSGSGAVSVTKMV